MKYLSFKAHRFINKEDKRSLTWASMTDLLNTSSQWKNRICIVSTMKRQEMRQKTKKTKYEKRILGCTLFN